MTSIKHNLQQVHEHIAAAAELCGRDPEEITLLAVSKTKPASMISEAIASGQQVFGENYVQEGVEKIAKLSVYPDLQWHFIGPLQSNKSRLVAENFAWCHTINRLHIANRLNNQRPEYLPPLNVLIQVNISNEYNKSGIQLESLPTLTKQVSTLPRLRFRGLMAIPTAEQDYYRQLAVCQKMAAVFYSLQQDYPDVDTLSLGMSNDMKAAITAGSTLVRIGTAIFSTRNYAHIL